MSYKYGKKAEWYIHKLLELLRYRVKDISTVKDGERYSQWDLVATKGSLSFLVDVKLRSRNQACPTFKLGEFWVSAPQLEDQLAYETSSIKLFIFFVLYEPPTFIEMAHVPTVGRLTKTGKSWMIPVSTCNYAIDIDSLY